VRRVGRGTPVVLVHGSAGGLDSWDPIVPLLSDEFELWVYARRGYAPSEQPVRQKTFADDVRDLKAVLAEVARPAHVVGASYGGTIALHAALASVPAIRSAVVFEPPVFAAGSQLKCVLDQYRDLLQAGELSAATMLFARNVSRVPDVILAALADANDGDGDRGDAAAEAVGCLHDLEAMAADEVDLQRWGKIDTPVLLMQGSDTWPPMPETMDVLALAMPNADRLVLPGQSHFATHTAPALFAESVRDFARANN
jgi:pimeloyl-ACP methyl ester carboxylesterase